MASQPTRKRRSDDWRTERKASKRKLNKQHKQANIRAKYGPARKPSPVIVKSLETGEVLRVEDQRRFLSKRAASSLENAARDLGFESYQEYLQSPHWKALRLRVIDRDGQQCRRCGSRANLTVHHRYYAKFGAEPLESLETLCAPCHRQTHRSHRSHR